MTKSKWLVACVVMLAVVGLVLTVLVPKARGPREVTTTRVEPRPVQPTPPQRAKVVAPRTGVAEAGG